MTAPISLFSASAVALLAVLAGPFGTYDALPLPVRGLYWGLVVVTSCLAGVAAREAIERMRPNWGFSLQGLALVVPMTVLYTPVLYVIAHAVTGAYREVPSIWYMGMLVLLLTASIHVLISLWSWSAGEEAQLPRLAERLGIPDGETIRHVAAMDHYVDVATSSGSERVLLRFSDALAELDGLDGMQVHRSHWVARAAVRGLVREAGRVTIVLDDESHVPVSRAFQDKVKQSLGPCLTAEYQARGALPLPRHRNRAGAPAGEHRDRVVTH